MNVRVFYFCCLFVCFVCLDELWLRWMGYGLSSVSFACDKYVMNCVFFFLSFFWKKERGILLWLTVCKCSVRWWWLMFISFVLILIRYRLPLWAFSFFFHGDLGGIFFSFFIHIINRREIDWDNNGLHGKKGNGLNTIFTWLFGKKKFRSRARLTTACSKKRVPTISHSIKHCHEIINCNN